MESQIPVVKLTGQLPDEIVTRTKGLFVEADYNETTSGEQQLVFKGNHVHVSLVRPVFRESVRVLKPNGGDLFALIRGVLSPNVCASAYENLVGLGGDLGQTKRTMAIGEGSGGASAREGILGYRGSPECGPAAFCKKHPDKFAKSLPFFRELDRVYREHAPEQYEHQAKQASGYSAFLIPGTSFSTATINSTVRTRLHTDANNLRGGLGVYAALVGGDFTGGELVMPQYRVAVKFGSQDVLLCDSHVLHGNTPMSSEQPYQRLAVIAYFSESVKRCREKAA
jgi:hypothetical protein